MNATYWRFFGFQLPYVIDHSAKTRKSGVPDFVNLLRMFFVFRNKSVPKKTVNYKCSAIMFFQLFIRIRIRIRIFIDSKIKYNSASHIL